MYVLGHQEVLYGRQLVRGTCLAPAMDLPGRSESMRLAGLWESFEERVPCLDTYFTVCKSFSIRPLESHHHPEK